MCFRVRGKAAVSTPINRPRQCCWLGTTLTELGLQDWMSRLTHQRANTQRSPCHIFNETLRKFEGHRIASTLQSASLYLPFCKEMDFLQLPTNLRRRIYLQAYLPTRSRVQFSRLERARLVSRVRRQNLREMYRQVDFSTYCSLRLVCRTVTAEVLDIFSRQIAFTPQDTIYQYFVICRRRRCRVYNTCA